MQEELKGRREKYLKQVRRFQREKLFQREQEELQSLISQILRIKTEQKQCKPQVRKAIQIILKTQPTIRKLDFLNQFRSEVSDAELISYFSFKIQDLNCREHALIMIRPLMMSDQEIDRQSILRCLINNCGNVNIELQLQGCCYALQVLHSARLSDHFLALDLINQLCFHKEVTIKLNKQAVKTIVYLSVSDQFNIGIWLSALINISYHSDLVGQICIGQLGVAWVLDLLQKSLVKRQWAVDSAQLVCNILCIKNSQTRKLLLLDCAFQNLVFSSIQRNNKQSLLIALIKPYLHYIPKVNLFPVLTSLLQSFRENYLPDQHGKFIQKSILILLERGRFWSQKQNSQLIDLIKTMGLLRLVQQIDWLQ